MKRTVAALLAAAALFALVPAEAADDPSGDASGLTAYAGLASIATPVLASAAATALTVAGGKQVVRIVDAAVCGLTDLTVDVIDSVNTTESSSDNESTVVVHTGKQQKTIPLVVRKDYLELNQAVADDKGSQAKQSCIKQGAGDAASHP